MCRVCFHDQMAARPQEAREPGEECPLQEIHGEDGVERSFSKRQRSRVRNHTVDAYIDRATSIHR
jgi:hypothetical protein